VRLGSDGASHGEIVAQVAERLKDHPEIDADRLVRIATGESKDAICLNLDAFRQVHSDISRHMNAIAAEARENVVEKAIENLVAEARALAARGSAA
jgi:hypothetical protein